MVDATMNAIVYMPCWRKPEGTSWSFFGRVFDGQKNGETGVKRGKRWENGVRENGVRHPFPHHRYGYEARIVRRLAVVRPLSLRLR